MKELLKLSKDSFPNFYILIFIVANLIHLFFLKYFYFLVFIFKNKKY